MGDAPSNKPAGAGVVFWGLRGGQNKWDGEDDEWVAGRMMEMDFGVLDVAGRGMGVDGEKEENVRVRGGRRREEERWDGMEWRRMDLISPHGMDEEKMGWLWKERKMAGGACLMGKEKRGVVVDWTKFQIWQGTGFLHRESM